MKVRPAAILFCINESGGRVLWEALKRMEVRLLVCRRNQNETSNLPYIIAEKNGIPYTFMEANDDLLYDQIQSLQPDLVISGWYHLKIPKRIIQISRIGAINLHPSLLPKYRGATPVEWCIMNGETVTGLSMHKLSERFDKGDILWQKEIEISQDETAGGLLKRIEEMVPEALDHLILRIREKDFIGEKQNESEASYFPKRSPKDGQINWNWDAKTIHNRVRGLSPWPKAFFCLKDNKYQVTRSRPLAKRSDEPPGTLLAILANDGRVAHFACGDGKVIELLEIVPPLQPESAKGDRPL